MNSLVAGGPAAGLYRVEAANNKKQRLRAGICFRPPHLLGAARRDACLWGVTTAGIRESVTGEPSAGGSLVEYWLCNCAAHDEGVSQCCGAAPELERGKWERRKWRRMKDEVAKDEG